MKLSEFNRQRERQLMSMKGAKSVDKERFFRLLRAKVSPESINALNGFAEEMESQDYRHGVLSKAQYMAHPYRVALRLVEHFPKVDQLYIQLALCHNIVEVSNVTEDLLTYLGPELMKHVNTLTVDRKRQWDHNYKKIYYERISEKKITRIIKIFDKMDNLFILSENKDKEVKLKYLKEIENHLMPFVKLDILALEDYFEALLKINHELIGELK